MIEICWVFGSSIGGGDLETAGSKDDSVRKPEATVGRESSSTKGVADSHFPVNRLVTECKSDSQTNLPHAGKKLNDTTITECKSNDNVWLNDTASANVD